MNRAELAWAERQLRRLLAVARIREYQRCPENVLGILLPNGVRRRRTRKAA